MTRTPRRPVTPPATGTDAPGAGGPVKRILGFCWFHRDDYDRARSVMADPEVLFPTFDEWLKSAKRIESEVTARGDKVVRIRFDGASFLLFCASRSRRPDEQARAAWAAQEVRKRYGAAVG